VELGSRQADYQPLGNLAIAVPMGHQCQHLAFAWGQVLARHRQVGGCLDQRLGRLGRQCRPAGIGGPDGAGQVLGRDVFEQVTDGPRLQGAAHQLLLPEAGQGDHLYPLAALADGADGADAVHAGHHQIHEHHVRLDLAAQVQRLFPVGRLARQLHVVKGLHKEPEPGAHHAVVVNN
jgi:hypothetical protein